MTPRRLAEKSSLADLVASRSEVYILVHAEHVFVLHSSHQLVERARQNRRRDDAKQTPSPSREHIVNYREVVLIVE